MSTAKIDFACLGFIAEKPSTGYDIHQATRSGSLRLIIKASQAAVYDALRRLQASGVLTCNAIAQIGKPDKQVFRITDEGRGMLPQYAAAMTSKTVDEGAVLLLGHFGYLIPRAIIASAVAIYSAIIIDEIELLSKECTQPSQGSGNDTFRANLTLVLEAKLRLAKAVDSSGRGSASRTFA